MLAAYLAREGFTGPERILEGEKGLFAGACPDPVPEAVAADPGRPWELTRTSIKPWPCCRHTHPAIDASIELNRKLAGAAIKSVKVGAYRAALDVCNRPLPEDTYSAKFSLQHTVAIALADGKVDQASFDTAARNRIAAERIKVAVSLAPAIDQAYPANWGVEIDVTTADGRTLRATRRDAKGDPENPVSAEELKVKAAMLLGEGGLANKNADRFIAAILGLVDDRPVRELGLMEWLRPDEAKPRFAQRA